MSMIQRVTPSRNAIAVSVSKSPDMAHLGLIENHLRDAVVGIFRYALHRGSRIVYGGDLRQYGFSELLFELVARYFQVLEHETETAGVTNYFAWPVHISMPYELIQKTANDFVGSVNLVCLDIHGLPMTLHQRSQLKSRKPTKVDWSEGLTNMRQYMLRNTDARIILGGQIEQHKGIMPGIGEEALMSLRAGQPLFVIGGFGGCARDIADSMGISSSEIKKYRHWNRRSEFEAFSANDLRNGLSQEENTALATSPYIDQIIVLILRGLLKVSKKKRVDYKD